MPCMKPGSGLDDDILPFVAVVGELGENMTLVICKGTG